MNEMSGSLLFPSGVGTQMMMTSAAAACSKVVAAAKAPAVTSGPSASLGTSTR
jgi:hypothetical protein